ncbi:transposase [Leptospira sarikeiensis]|uniref:Transposase n=1 Tax=Leptospira sarikeiensis TaxID=2484943 RepID=A0A4R9K590_9LEPT|nr:transposase [Leptospira sarikeiensis]TGL59518.1 transposase [Leptospira sarikeiensis]
MKSLSLAESVMLIMTPLPDDLWESVKVKIKGKQAANSNPLGGRPKSNDRHILAGIVYRMEHGISWKDLPARFGKRSTIHSRYKKWLLDGTLEACKTTILQYYLDRFQIELNWNVLEGERVKRRIKKLDDFEEDEIPDTIPLPKFRIIDPFTEL